MKNTVSVPPALVGLVMFMAIWELLALWVARPILPSPVTVVPIFAKGLFGDLGLHFLASAGRVLAAMALSVAEIDEPKPFVSQSFDRTFSHRFQSP